MEELNKEIRRLLHLLNQKKFQKTSGSRSELFEKWEQPTLQPLPKYRYKIIQFKMVKVQISYHIALEKHNYSVPYKYIGQSLEARYSDFLVELFHKNKLIATHPRSFKAGSYTTNKEHMPEKHKQYLAWTPQRLINWASETGPNTKKVAPDIINGQIIPQQGFNSIKGLISLSKRYGVERMEKACFRALRIGSSTYKTVKNILVGGLEDKPIPAINATTDSVFNDHENIRGVGYFTKTIEEIKND